MKRLWTLWMVMLMVLVLMAGAGCDGLVDDDDDDAVGPEGEPFVGSWMRYSTTEEDSTAGDYAGVVLLGNGSGTHYMVIEQDDAEDMVLAEYIEWSVEGSFLLIDQIDLQTQDTTSFQMSFSFNADESMVTFVGTNDDNSSFTEVYVKYNPDMQDSELVGEWVATSPAEMAGVQIDLNGTGTGSYLEPGDDSPDSFSWGTHEGYLGIALYQDAVGFIAPYTITSTGFTLDAGDDGVISFAPDTGNGGGGGGGSVVAELVGSWYLKSMMAEDAGSSYAIDVRSTMTLDTDGTGEILAEFDDEDGVITINLPSWGETTPGVLTLVMEGDAPDTVVASYTVDGDVMVISAPSQPDMPATVQTYVRWTDTRPADYQATWILSKNTFYDMDGNELPGFQGGPRMTLVLGADDGVRYEEDWDGEGPMGDLSIEEFEFDWSVTQGHFIESETATGLGDVIEFSLENLTQTSVLTASFYEWMEGEGGNEMSVMLEAELVKYAGVNPADLEGTWVAYGLMNGNFLPTPPVNLVFEAAGTGEARSMEYNPDTDAQEFFTDPFTWLSADGMMMVLDDVPDVVIGQVVPYLREGHWMDIIMPPMRPMDPSNPPAGPDTLMLVLNVGNNDMEIVGTWNNTDRIENGTSMGADPNGRLELNFDGTATAMWSGEDNTVVTQNGVWNSKIGWTKVLMFDEIEETDPFELYMTARYEVDTVNETLTITSYDWDDMGQVVEYVEIYEL